jgi:SET domain-containing protein
MKSKYQPGDYALQVKRSSAGLGLFAGEDLPSKVCLIEYTGRLLGKGEEFTSRSKYLFEVTKTKTIDGQARTNKARYINHSCKPNSEPEIRGGRVFIFSRRKIKAGEEITYDYGKEYFDEHIAPFGCRCVFCQQKTA